MSETLDWMRFDADRGELIVQLTGGGCAERFYHGMPAPAAANRLRYLADKLDMTVELRAEKAERAAAQPNGDRGG